MNRATLAKEIFKTAYLRGEFKLRSGQTSNEYFDKYRFEAQPKLLSAIAEQMAQMIPPRIEVLAGLEMGGIPIATALSLHTGIPAIFVRKKAKEYGTCQIAEGADYKNKNVLIIEDVITTGGQVKLSAADLRSTGAKIEHLLCVIHRGKTDPFTEDKLQMHSLFTMEELKNSGS